MIDKKINSNSTHIKSAAVLGSGVMGAAIAAHLANAGIKVLLLDLPQKGLGKKNSLAKNAIVNLTKITPAPLVHKNCAELIIPGNFEDDLEKIKEIDWVIEVIIENLPIKQQLYTKIETFRGVDTIVSSNTSTIPLSSLIEGRNNEFKQHFCITHFFNPPRYMRLLELVSGTHTKKTVIDKLEYFCSHNLGKGVVKCKDSPGFIANRIGIYWLQTAMLEAFKYQMTVEEVDKILAKPFGIPKTGVFGLLDLVGIDLLPLLGQTMQAALPKEDPFVTSYQQPSLISKMLEQGYTGRKGKGGFYRLNITDNNTKIKEAINLVTGQYSTVNRKVHFNFIKEARNDLKLIFMAKNNASQYAWSVMSQVLCYAANLLGEIADNIYDIDQAMQLGYNWKFGPFALIDKIGKQWFVDKLIADKRTVPKFLSNTNIKECYALIEDKQSKKVLLHYLNNDYKYLPAKSYSIDILSLQEIKNNSKPICKNQSASLWDIGDGVCCIEFTSKQNTIDLDIISLINETIDIVQQQYNALVIYNDADNFSLGANIGLALFAANIAAWDMIEEFLSKGQQVYQKLKYSSFPVVAATGGMTLGGGCEIILHADAVQAHIESYIGLVEVGVGLIPAWGGCKEMLLRWLQDNKKIGGSMRAVSKVFEIIGIAKVAKSAIEAQEMKFINSNSYITMNRDFLLTDAKKLAISMIQDYKPPEKQQDISLPGSAARVAMNIAVKALVKAGKASPYDQAVAKELAFVLSGGNTDVTTQESEDLILELERKAFMKLIKNYQTLDRMEHILVKHKPLRN